MKQGLENIDNQKWDMLLDLLEHPENYSETQKDELLGNKEVKELYNQMVETRQALDFSKSKEEMRMPSMDEEWKKIMRKERKASPMRKVAAIAAILVVSSITFAAIHLVTRSRQASTSDKTEIVASTKDSTQQVASLTKANTVQKTDSVITKLPLVYENAELQSILTPIAEHFHVSVSYQNESSRHIRLYLQLTEDMSLDDIIELMNHFEKVNIRHEGNSLIVE